MVLEISQITGKYISKLEQKKFLKVVKLEEAKLSVKQAVEETVNIAKKDIIDAVEPLKRKIAQKDEFIAGQKSTNKILQNQNNELQQTNSFLQTELETQKSASQELHATNEKLQSKINNQKATNRISQEQNQKLNDKNSALQKMLEKYKTIVKEAYKQGITPEIRKQKSGIADILTGLIQHKSMIATQKEEVKLISKKSINIKTEPAISKSKETLKPVIPKTTLEKAVIKPKTSIVNAKNIQTQKSIITPSPVVKKDILTTNSTTEVSSKVLSKIINERKNQVLDKKRMNISTELIKDILGDMQTYDWKGISEQYKKLNNNKKFNEIAKNNSLKISRHMGGFGYMGEGASIRFIDPNNKDLLSIKFDAMDKTIKIWIYDENGLPMVTSKTKNGVVEELRVRFNKVKHIAEPEVLYDQAFNNYAKNVINQTKKRTTSKTYAEKAYHYKEINYKTRTVNYYTPNNINLVSEYFVDNKHISTGIANPINGKLEKEFRLGGNGFERNQILYEMNGISSITKYKQDNEIFSIQYNLYPENKRVGSQYLYEKKDGNKNPHQKLAYEKTNLGLINHPLTSGFSYYDLTKHGIKPWDFSMLNNYIK